MFEKLGKIKDSVLEKKDRLTKILLLLTFLSTPALSKSQNANEQKELTNDNNIELAQEYLINITKEIKKQNENVKRTVMGENVYTAELGKNHAILSRDNSFFIIISEDGKKGYVDTNVDGKVDRFVNIENMGTKNLNEELDKRVAENGGNFNNELSNDLKEQQKLLNQADYGKKSIESLKEEAKKFGPFNLMDVKVIDFDGNVVNYIDIGSGESDIYEGADRESLINNAQEKYTRILESISNDLE